MCIRDSPKIQWVGNLCTICINIFTNGVGANGKNVTNDNTESSEHTATINVSRDFERLRIA